MERAAELTGKFVACNFDGADFRGGTLGEFYSACSFVGANLSGARLYGTFKDTDFTDAVFTDADLTEGSFINCLGLPERAKVVPSC